MYQVRIHGRRGQGMVTTVEVLSLAAFRDNHWAQVSSCLGIERPGAPVVSSCRIDNEHIRLHDPIVEPDAVIINDPTLLHEARVFEGMSSSAHLLVNATRSFEELGVDDFTSTLEPRRAVVVPATELAVLYLGRPLPAAALVGAFAALTGQISLDSVLSAINGRFSGGVVIGNTEAAIAAYEFVTALRRTPLPA